MLLGQAAPILAELSAVERGLAHERAAHAETRDALQHANLRAREARTALAAEASSGVLHLVRKAVVEAAKGSSSAQQRLAQLYLILPPRGDSHCWTCALLVALRLTRCVGKFVGRKSLWEEKWCHACSRYQVNKASITKNIDLSG